MTKKEFLKNINGKRVIIKNIEEIKKEAKEEIKRTLLFWEKHGVLKENKRLGFKFFYKIAGTDEKKLNLIGYKKDNKLSTLVLEDAFLHNNNRLNLYKNNENKVEVHSTYIRIFGIRFNIKDLIIAENGTFYTQYSDCVYKIID